MHVAEQQLCDTNAPASPPVGWTTESRTPERTQPTRGRNHRIISSQQRQRTLNEGRHQTVIAIQHHHERRLGSGDTTIARSGRTGIHLPDKIDGDTARIRHSMPAIVENCTQHIDGRLIIRPIIHDDDAFRANRLGQCRLDCFANQRTLIATGNYHCHCCHAASLSGSRANHPPALRATSRQRKVRFEQHHHQGNNNPLFCIILIEYDAENYLMMQKETRNEAL